MADFMGDSCTGTTVPCQPRLAPVRWSVVDSHPGIGLERARLARVAKDGELRRPSGKPLSREVLARRTGQNGYERVSADTIKAAEQDRDTKSARRPGDDTLAALYHALGDATPEEWPEGALAEARYLAGRWLDEGRVGRDVALARRDRLLALIGSDLTAMRADALVAEIEEGAQRHARPPRSPAASGPRTQHSDPAG